MLPLINPFVTARAVTTADVLSGGRMMLGFGVGWDEDEYRWAGEEFHNRGARADEIVKILRLLWTTDEKIEYRGKHYSFGPIEFQPKPAQRPHPPMFYGGGSSPAVMRRAADLDGFVFHPDLPLDEMKAMMDDIMRRRQENGRVNEPYQFTASVPTLSPGHLSALEDLGVHRVLLEVGLSPFDESRTWLPITSEALSANLEDIAGKLLR